MARRSEHSHDEIKAMILNSAESIVKKEGGAALKVRRIAMDIGYSVSSVYMVFSSMSDLNMHLKTRTCNMLCRQLESVSAETVGIELLALKYLEFAMDNPYLWRMFFEYQLPLGDPLLVDYLQQQQRLVAIFELGFLNDSINSRHFAHLFVHGLEGVIMQALLSQQSRENTQSEIGLFIRCFKSL